MPKARLDSCHYFAAQWLGTNRGGKVQLAEIIWSGSTFTCLSRVFVERSLSVSHQQLYLLMNSLRVCESATSVSRAARESLDYQYYSNCLQPVSRVLHFERYRGFEQEQRHHRHHRHHVSNIQSLSHSHALRAEPRACKTFVPSTSSVSSPVRSFSSSPRCPAPPRPPGRLSPRVITVDTKGDEENFNLKVGKEFEKEIRQRQAKVERQQQQEVERLIVQSAEEREADRRLKAWVAEIADVKHRVDETWRDFLFRNSFKEIHKVEYARAIQVYKQRTTAEFETLHARLHEQEIAIVKFLKAVEAPLREVLLQLLWAKYVEEHGAELFDLHRRSLGLQTAVQQLQHDTNQLKFTIAWRKWRHQQLEIQRNEVSRAVTALKSVDAEQQKTTDAAHFHERRLRGLRTDEIPELQSLYFEHHVPSRPFPDKQWAIILRSRYRASMNYAEFLANLLHHWRDGNRMSTIVHLLPEAASQYPLAQQLQKVLTKINEIHGDVLCLIDDLWDIRHVWPNHYKVNRDDSESVARRKFHVDRLRRRLVENNDMVYEMQQACRELQEGYLLYNPLLQSPIGQTRVLVLAPLARQLVVSNDLDSAVRKLRDRLQHSMGRSPPGPLALRIASKLGEWESDSSGQRGDFKALMNELDFGITTSLLQSGLSETDFSVGRSYDQFLEADTVQMRRKRLWKGFFTTKHMVQNMIANPWTFIRSPFLTGAKKKIEVNYVISSTECMRLLAQLGQASVIGIDIRSSNGSGKGVGGIHYISFATLNRVIIVEVTAHTPWPAIGRLLENDEILKVAFNVKTFISNLEELGINHKSIVDVYSPATFLPATREKRYSEGHTRPTFFVNRPGYYPPTVEGWAGVAAKSSMLSVIGNVALGALGNLITLVNALNDRLAETLSPKWHAELWQARAWLRSNYNRHNVFHNPHLGPIRWDNDVRAQSTLWPAEYVKAFGPDHEARADLLGLVRATVHNLAKSWVLKSPQSGKLTVEELQTEAFQTALAAFLLYTSFGTDLQTISKMLSLEYPAAAILSVGSRGLAPLRLELNLIRDLKAAKETSFDTTPLPETPRATLEGLELARSAEVSQFSDAPFATEAGNGPWTILSSRSDEDGLDSDQVIRPLSAKSTHGFTSAIETEVVHGNSLALDDGDLDEDERVLPSIPITRAASSSAVERKAYLDAQRRLAANARKPSHKSTKKMRSMIKVKVRKVEYRMKKPSTEKKQKPGESNGREADSMTAMEDKRCKYTKSKQDVYTSTLEKAEQEDAVDWKPLSNNQLL